MFCSCDIRDVHKEVRTDQVVCMFRSLAPRERLIDFYRLPKGLRHQNFLLSTDKGKFLLRIRERGDAPYDRPEVEQAVFARLAGRIVHPRRLCSQREHDIEYALYDFTEGTELSETLESLQPVVRDDVYRRIGRALAKIHESARFDRCGFLDATLGVDHPLPPLAQWFEVFSNRTLRERLPEETQHALERTLAFHEDRLADMDKDICLVHGDLSADNIVLGEDGVAFLDWEFCAAGHRYADIGQLMRGVDGCDVRTDAFARGYREVLPDGLADDWRRLAKLRDLLSLMQLISQKEHAPADVRDWKLLLQHTQLEIGS